MSPLITLLFVLLLIIFVKCDPTLFCDFSDPINDEDFDGKIIKKRDATCSNYDMLFDEILYNKIDYYNDLIHNDIDYEGVLFDQATRFTGIKLIKITNLIINQSKFKLINPSKPGTHKHKFLPNQRALNVIQLNDVTMNLEGYQQFANLMQSMHNVYHVKLTNCKLISETNDVMDFHWITKLKTWFSSSTTIITIDDCSINKIDDGSFSNAIENLRMFSLANNKLKQFNRLWLSKNSDTKNPEPLNHLWYLDLSGNQIDKINQLDLINMPKLKVVKLNNNQLISLGNFPQLFSEVWKNLREFYISGNQIL